MDSQRSAYAENWFQDLTRETNGVTADNVAEVERQVRLWKARTKRGAVAEKWQPARHPSVCMRASTMKRLHGWTTPKIAAELLDVQVRHTVYKCVSRGDGAWAALGAWPWTACPAEDLARRWEREQIWRGLAEWTLTFRGAAPRWLKGA